MKNDLFKLLSTYEYLHFYNDAEVPFRIETFRSIERHNIYRARVWVLNSYNLYPSLNNSGASGEDLHKVHSADQINQDITTLLADDTGILIGKHFENEEELLNYIKLQIIKHYS